MGKGEGGGEQLNSYLPHLNPLPPGERRYFLHNSKHQFQNSKTILFEFLNFADWSLFGIWSLSFRAFLITHGKLNNHWLLCSPYGSSCTNSSSCSPMVWRVVARFQQYSHDRPGKGVCLEPHAGNGKRRRDRVLRKSVSRESLLLF